MLEAVAYARPAPGGLPDPRRLALEDAIERALALLDALDGDPDEEWIDEREPEQGF